MTEFKIEKDVAVPQIFTGVRSRYPLNEMEIGDSFEFESSLRAKISSAATHVARMNNKKFTIRKTDGKLRIWRIK